MLEDDQLCEAGGCRSTDDMLEKPSPSLFGSLLSALCNISTEAKMLLQCLTLKLQTYTRV